MPGRVLQGRVIRKKQKKTCTVAVSYRKKDSHVGKITSRVKDDYHVHDEHDEAQEGDIVNIIESPPRSKTKRWALLSIEAKSGSTTQESIGSESRGKAI